MLEEYAGRISSPLGHRQLCLDIGLGIRGTVFSPSAVDAGCSCCTTPLVVGDTAARTATAHREALIRQRVAEFLQLSRYFRSGIDGRSGRGRRRCWLLPCRPDGHRNNGAGCG
ncbi:hypothetical protein MRX96_028846 [Rhipicephalus microplus]